MLSLFTRLAPYIACFHVANVINESLYASLIAGAWLLQFTYKQKRNELVSRVTPTRVLVLILNLVVDHVAAAGPRSCVWRTTPD